MKNILIINAFLKSQPFIQLRQAFNQAFSDMGENLTVLPNDKVYSLLSKKAKGQPVLFFDKDVILGRLLQKSGYKLVNDINTIEICDDKAKTYAALCGEIPMPKTLLAPFTYSGVEYDNFDFLQQVQAALSYPIVVKSSVGSFGGQVALANSYEELKSLTQNLSRFGRVIYQEFIASSKGKDIRVYVIGGKTVAMAMRKNTNDFRSNVGSGGSMISLDQDEYADYKALAEKSALSVGADFAGVDLLIGENNKPLLCEINSNAHFNALSKVSGVNVAKKIAEYYLTVKKSAENC